MAAGPQNNPNALNVANLGGPVSTPSAYNPASSVSVIGAGFHSLLGWTLSEVSGSRAGAVTFYDGAGASPTNANYGQVNIPAGGTVVNWFGVPGGLTGSSGQLFAGFGGSGYISGAIFYQ